MHILFNSKERAYWEAKVAAAASTSKKQWQTLNKLMCKDVKSQTPDSATAEAFSKFFTHKVESVRSATENAAPPSFSPCLKPCCRDTFQHLTPEQVLFLIKRAPDKTSDLDPVPTWFVQEFAPIFALFFAHVSNVSINQINFQSNQFIAQHNIAYKNSQNNSGISMISLWLYNGVRRSKAFRTLTPLFTK